MSWDRTGQVALGMYLNELPFQGVIESSRVKYGGKVQHIVVLNNPLLVYGNVRDRLLINEEDALEYKES